MEVASLVINPGFALFYLVVFRPFNLFLSYVRIYGYAGILLLLFGNNVVWKIQFEVLTRAHPQTALEYKSARQKESDTVAIAGSILAQIAITSLSLNNLSQAHWTARGFFVFSLVASVISVYFASAQQKALSRLLSPEDIRFWIRNKKESDLNWEQTRSKNIPSVAAVLAVSAPNVLLSLAVHAFLIGLGIYLGFVWINDLDQSSTPSGNRAIFITYITSVSICYSLYSLSNIAASDKFDKGVVLEELLDKAQSNKPTDDVPLSSIDAPGRPSHFLRNSSEMQSIIRESARMKRDLATIDDRIMVLLGNLGQANDGAESPS